jgi:hypothetical protein
LGLVLFFLFFKGFGSEINGIEDSVMGPIPEPDFKN